MCNSGFANLLMVAAACNPIRKTFKNDEVIILPCVGLLLCGLYCKGLNLCLWM